MKHYYFVTAKCGHVTRKYYVPVTFALPAESAKDAAARVREYPRVKHHHNDAILSVRRVSYADYLHQKEVNDKDPFLHCSCIQDQMLIADLLEPRLVLDPHFEKEIRVNKIESRVYRYRRSCLRYADPGEIFLEEDEEEFFDF